MNPTVVAARVLFLEGLLQLMRRQAEIAIKLLQNPKIPLEGQKVLYLEMQRYENVLGAAVKDLDVDPADDAPLLGMPQVVGMRERIDSATQSVGAVNMIVNRLDAGGFNDVNDTRAQKTALRERFVTLRDAILSEVDPNL